MSRKIKRALSLVIVFTFIFSLMTLSASAAVTMTLESSGTVTLDGVNDGTVTVTAKTGNAISGAWTLEAYFSPKGYDDSDCTTANSYFTLSSISGNAFEAESTNLVDGQIIFTDSVNLTGFSVAEGGDVCSATYTVDKETPAGTYYVSFHMESMFDSSYSEQVGTDSDFVAAIKVERASTAEGYTVVLSSSADSVETGDTLEVYLDVTNANVTTFNDVDLTLTYDSANFTFEKESSLVNGFSVDTTTAGTLIIRGYGNDILISDGHEFTLKFTAGNTTAENLTFALNSAKVDVANHSNVNVAEATPSGSPVTVSITEPAVTKYTVIFVGGEGAIGTAPTQEDTAEGGTFTLPANPFTKTGYTFTGWNDGTTTYQAGAVYTMPAANVTFTAQWKLNDPSVSVDELSTAYLDGYTLIKATITDANGNVPTYDGNAMYQIKNVSGQTAYDANAYYYIVKTAEYDTAKVGYAAVTADTITKDGDANRTEVLDINDAQFVYNLYNTDTITVTYTPTAAQLLASDVNGDGAINVQDCQAVVQALS